jgi:hypothetical protein
MSRFDNESMQILAVRTLVVASIGLNIVTSRQEWAMCTVDCAGPPMPCKPQTYLALDTWAGVPHSRP